MRISWPSSHEEYLRLARALIELVAGRTDVVARYHDFEKPDPQNPGQKVRFKGWGPWKGKRVAKDYEPGDGETVMAFKDHRSGGLERRVIKPLSPDNLVLHLRGRERLGVYVLDEQMRVRFVAADFDDHEGTLDPAAVWAEVSRFVETCRAHDWIVHVERSKSGAGYHVWLFFDAPVQASHARAIGRWLFEESQTLREGDDFSTFDRFFPAQSVLPPAARGFGNLIGLPLHGYREYCEGRSAWLDEAGELVADPAAYTLGILESGLNPAAHVGEFMAEWDLAPEKAEVYHGAPRDTEHPVGTAEELEAVTSRCRFLQWASEPGNQPEVSEPLWFGMISNACRFESDDWIHEASRHYPGYSALETDMKIAHARSSGPQKCKTIQENGFTGCPAGGCKLPSGNPAASPAGLAAWQHRREPRKTGDRTVNMPKSGADAPKPAPPPADDLPASGPWGGDIPLREDTGMPWPFVPSWNITSDGVLDHNNSPIVLRPLWVDALTKNGLGMWGVSLKFFDLDWHLKSWAIPRDRLHEQGGVLGRELAAQGLPVVPGKEKWVSRFIVQQEGVVKERIRAAGRLGWLDASESPAVFVLPDQVLGEYGQEIVYQPEAALHTAETLHGAGKLQDWQKHVAAPCVGNPILMFALMVGLAGPLVKLCAEQSGGWHIYGVTTGGKTTAAQVAASVWGCGADPQEGPEVTSICKWYTTGNALEATAEIRNDMVLALDEIGEVDVQELGRIIYQLAGGLSKGRSTASGGLRAAKTWRLLFLSTGEKSAAQMLAQVGQTAKGGQRVRMPDIPADDDKGERAIIVDTHGVDAKDFVQSLKSSCARFYGLAGPVFVTYLIAKASTRGLTGLSGDLREELREMEAIMLVDRDTGELLDLPPEGRRVCRRFSLVALAGAKAAEAGIIDWDLDSIVGAVLDVRDRWLAEQGTERSETDRALAYFRDQLIAQASRIRRYDATDRVQIRDALGFRTDDYYLLTEHGVSELCGEHDSRSILRTLRARGFLYPQADRLTRKSPKLAGYGNRRLNLYWVSVDFLGESDPNATDEDVAVGKAPQPDLDLDVPPEPPPLGPDDAIPYE